MTDVTPRTPSRLDPWERARKIVDAMPIEERIRMKNDNIVVNDEGVIAIATAKSLSVLSSGFWLGKMWPPEGKCANCFVRPATVTWDNGVGWMALSHSYLASRWCARCAIEAQLKHARERAAMIPRLEKQLSELKDE